MSTKKDADDPRVNEAVNFINSFPNITVPMAMKLANFTEAEIKEKKWHRQIQRRFPLKKTRLRATAVTLQSPGIVSAVST